MKEIILRGHKVVKGHVEGEALVTTQPISFQNGVDPETGFVTDRHHEMNGVNLKDKIVIFPEEKGSSGGSYQIYEMARCKTAPKGMINRKTGGIVAVGAIISHIPVVDKLEPDPFTLIKTGDWVEIDADNGIVRVRPKNI